MFLQLPYVGIDSCKLSRALAKILDEDRHVRLRTVYNNFKVGQYFALPWQLTPSVVYKFACSVDRGVTYIGITTRQLVARIKEHFDTKKQLGMQNHVATCSRCADTGNCIDLFKVLMFCRN